MWKTKHSINKTESDTLIIYRKQVCRNPP
jgi:hypothetical protein